VVTNVGTAHIENFADGQAGIARAKFELVSALPPNGVAFLNCDDPMFRSLAATFQAAWFTLAPALAPIRRQWKRARMRPGCISGIAPASAGSLHSAMLGKHNASNAMAGLAVALEAGVSLDAAIAALAALTAGDKRGQVMEIDGATILNDSYNSNPEALRSMIRTLAARPAARRILVAGEMLELGEYGHALHAACGIAPRRGRPRPGGRGAGQRGSSGRGGLRRRRGIAVSAQRRSRRPLAAAERCARRRGAGEGLARRAPGAGHRDQVKWPSLPSRIELRQVRPRVSILGHVEAARSLR
jgi:hypothetical protein